jgi:hypothetical protein
MTFVCVMPSRDLFSAPNIGDYHFDTWSQLPHFETATEEWKKTKDSIEIIGDIIVRHGLYNDVGVVLLHRHFDITENEILVEHVNSTQSVTQPVLIADADPTVIPHSFMFSQHSTFKWAPYEFTAPCVDSARKVVNVFSNTEFLAEIQQTLVDLSLVHVYGLQIRY